LRNLALLSGYGRIGRSLAPGARAAIAPLGLLLVAVLVLLVLAERYSALYDHNVVDDALISMQYAKNWVLGNGLVFNVGERVEGYTNFLWVAVLAPLYAASQGTGTDFVLMATRVNIGIAALTLVVVYAIAKQLWDARVLPTLLALGLCVVDNSYVAWAALGLEGHLLSLCLLLAVWCASASFPNRGFCIGLALTAAHMTRPDAGLFAVFLLAGLGATWLVARLQARPAAEQAEHLKVALTAGATWLSVYGAYFAWRYQYYGWLLPNTYYAKVGAGELDAWARGMEYLSDFRSERAWLPALAPLALFVSTTPLMRSVILYLIAHAVYVTSVGGDFFAGHRFFVAQIPLFALALGLLLDAAVRAATAWIERSSRRDPRRVLLAAGWVTAALLSLLLLQLYERGKQTGPLQGEIIERGGLARIHRSFMQWLSRNKPADASFASCAIGAPGFDGNFRRVVDICGLIDPVVAHRPVADFGKGVAGHEKRATLAEVLAKKPTYIDAWDPFEDLWLRGYVFDASMRLELMKTVQGVWRRDERRERGRYLQEGAWSFEPGEAAGWVKEGSAFEQFPTLTRPNGQERGIGERGAHANSFDETLGDLPTGRLLSPLFELRGDVMVLRVGGGHDRERLRVALWVDGRPVLSTTGVESEHLSAREWDIAVYRGKQARLEILDASSGPMGHILVDEVRQWSASDS
jgi:arabinofuranosyltransferase